MQVVAFRGLERCDDGTGFSFAEVHFHGQSLGRGCIAWEGHEDECIGVDGEAKCGEELREGQLTGCWT